MQHIARGNCSRAAGPSTRSTNQLLPWAASFPDARSTPAILAQTTEGSRLRVTGVGAEHQRSEGRLGVLPPVETSSHTDGLCFVTDDPFVCEEHPLGAGLAADLLGHNLPWTSSPLVS